jgi:hypothetical protein
MISIKKSGNDFFRLCIDRGYLPNEIRRDSKTDSPLRDIQYSVDDIRICKECRNIISQDKGSQFLNEINGWIGGSFS